MGMVLGQFCGILGPAVGRDGKSPGFWGAASGERGGAASAGWGTRGAEQAWPKITPPKSSKMGIWAQNNETRGPQKWMISPQSGRGHANPLRTPIFPGCASQGGPVPRWFFMFLPKLAFLDPKCWVLGTPPPTEFVSLTQATPLFFCSQSLQHVSDLHKKSQFHVFHPQNKRKVCWGKPINRFCGILGGKMGRNLGQVAEGEARLRVVQSEDVRRT